MLDKCEEAKYALNHDISELQLIHEKARDFFESMNLS
jgi:hypothetical protein